MSGNTIVYFAWIWTFSALLAADTASVNFPRSVAAGVPLRAYLTKRLPKRLGEPVHARMIEAVFAFDREVIPAGAELTGTVSRLPPEAKMLRATAMMGGDFTPLHRAQVAFTAVTLADGRTIPLQTVPVLPLTSIYAPPKPGKAKLPHAPTTGVLGIGKQQIKDQINAQINSRSRGVIDLVRGPDKKEHLQEILLMKLPYHPQWVRKGTRIDAELQAPVDFGSAPLNAEDFRLLGTSPAGNSVVHARLLTPLDSGTSQLGEKVAAALTQPLTGPGNKLVLPEGTRLTGTVTSVHRARWFHRGGQLRFTFDQVELDPEVARLAAEGKQKLETKITAHLDGAEASGTATVKVDQEGNVKVVESKTRLIAPAIALLMAGRAADNDTTRTGVHESNRSGRTLGGASGFGLLGMAASQSSRYVGTALGFYGLAWSVYLNIVAKGGEVEFLNNAAVDIRFGAR